MPTCGTRYYTHAGGPGPGTDESEWTLVYANDLSPAQVAQGFAVVEEQDAEGGAQRVRVLTADGSEALKQAARARGYRVLTKPVKPASLRAFLAAQRTLAGTRQAAAVV